MKYFKMEEFYKSYEAEKRGIVNRPFGKKNTARVEENIKSLCDNVLDPLREKLGKPIYVSSGYRSSELNKVLGGSKKSQHLVGQAADITRNTFRGNLRMAYELLTGDYSFDQLILERVDRDRYHYGWIHVSYDKSRIRGEVLVCYKEEYTVLNYTEYMNMVKDMEEILKYEI